MTLCVYALTGSRASRPAARGLGGDRLRLIRVGSIGAVVGDLTRVPKPSGENLRRYDRVIRALFERLPAILPARFGTCFDDPDELSFVLRARQASLCDALAKVRRRAQMNVRVMSDAGVEVERPSAHRPGEPDPEIGATTPRSAVVHPNAAGGAASAPGASYLRARAAAAARAREIPGFDPVRAAVRRWVREERVEKRVRITSVYHLIPRASADAYRRAAERAAAAGSLRVIVTGPWPPYAFATW